MEGDPGIRIVVVPYDSGHHGVRMGSGPDHLLNNGLPEALESAEQRVRSVTLHPESDPPAEVATSFEFAPEAGLSSEDLETVLGLVRERITVVAAGIASYDPVLDVDGSVLHAAVAGARSPGWTHRLGNKTHGRW